MRRRPTTTKPRAPTWARTWRAFSGWAWSRMPHRFSLRWHYRSAHESLISFSNEKFYDGNLRVFPSARTGRQDIGVQWRYVGGRYQRGAGKTNPAEVRAVVDEVVAHARANPKKTLGVGTFNLPAAGRDRGRARAKAAQRPRRGARCLSFHGQPGAVLRQEPRDDSGRRARRDPAQRHLRPRRGRTDLWKLRAAQPRRRLETHERARHSRPRALCRLQLSARRGHSPAAEPFTRRGRLQGLPPLRRERRHAGRGGLGERGRFSTRRRDREGVAGKGMGGPLPDRGVGLLRSIWRSSIRNAALDTWSESNAMARPIALLRPRATGIGSGRACSKSSAGG